MIRDFGLRRTVSLVITILLTLVFVRVVFAAKSGEITETEYPTSLSEATGIVRVVVAALGGLIAVLGVVVALKGIGGKADVELSLSGRKKVTFKKVSQGVVIIIIGAAILVGALYLLPEKRRELTVKGEGLTMEREGERTRVMSK